MKSSRLVVPALLAFGVFAQSGVVAQDKIIWKDGSTTAPVRVVSFSLGSIEYREKGGGAKTASSSAVMDLSVERVVSAYKRAFGSPPGDAIDFFIAAADKQRDPFLKQFGYWEAAKLLREHGQFAQAFDALGQLQEKCSNSGFVPRLFRWKIDYYLERQKLGDAAKVAAKYDLDSATNGYPRGAQVEAAFFKALIESMKDGASPAAVRRAMGEVLSDARDIPEIAARARLRIADAFRIEGDGASAMAEYEKIVGGMEGVPADAVAGAWLGTGHVKLAEAGGDKEKNRDAMLCFLRTYLLREEAPSYAAEALYFASKACGAWGGLDSGLMKRKLTYYLRRDYPDSEWASN